MTAYSFNTCTTQYRVYIGQKSIPKLKLSFKGKKGQDKNALGDNLTTCLTKTTNSTILGETLEKSGDLTLGPDKASFENNFGNDCTQNC